MTSAWTILSDSPELTLDLRRDADRIDLSIDVRTCDGVWEEAVAHALGSGFVGVVAHVEPTPNQLVALSNAARAAKAHFVVAMIGSRHQLRSLAHDLGITAVEDTGPMVAAISLLKLGLARPWATTTKDLVAADRARVGDAVGHHADGALVRTDGGLIAYSHASKATQLGIPRDVASARHALRCSQEVSRARVSTVEGVRAQAVLDVILGPERALSDPASKAALAEYDIPLPTEELCASASRAAAEAARIGFPVRIVLASPDLRVWQHPDLVANDVVGGAAVREAYRQLMTLAQHKSPNARLLGVTVGAATVAEALLKVRMEPLDGGVVLTEIGFADPHGVASSDTTLTVLPATAQGLERVLSRLEGNGLVLRGSRADRKHAVKAIGDVLLRLAAFVHEWQEQVSSVEVNPLAILVGGEIEVREACVSVGDAFTRSLRAGS